MALSFQPCPGSLEKRPNCAAHNLSYHLPSRDLAWFLRQVLEQCDAPPPHGTILQSRARLGRLRAAPTLSPSVVPTPTHGFIYTKMVQRYVRMPGMRYSQQNKKWLGAMLQKHSHYLEWSKSRYLDLSLTLGYLNA